MTSPAQAGGGAAFCPHCGYDLGCDEIISDGQFTYDPRFGVAFGRAALSITPACHHLIGSLMRERGRLVTRQVLADRLGYEGDDPSNLIAVLMARIRNHFRALKLECPIENIWSQGLRWIPQSAPELEAA
jgi:DNA-binding response OmpR family regulator